MRTEIGAPFETTKIKSAGPHNCGVFHTLFRRSEGRAIGVHQICSRPPKRNAGKTKERGAARGGHVGNAEMGDEGTRCMRGGNPEEARDGQLRPHANNNHPRTRACPERRPARMRHVCNCQGAVEARYMFDMVSTATW
eukprot:9417627-Pyramimonas_sp.AAC.1